VRVTGLESVGDGEALRLRLALKMHRLNAISLKLTCSVEAALDVDGTLQPHLRTRKDFKLRQLNGIHNVLITGGAGFVGGHLAERLLEQGHRVSIIDDLSTGSIENIAVAKKHSNFSYTIDTLFNKPVLAELIDQADVIFHLAAAVGVKLIVQDPVRTMETNIKGSEIVLELAAKKKKKVIIASTSEVYGKTTQHLFQEDSDLVLGSTSKSRWCYAASKIVDEFLAKAYWKQEGLPIVIVRLFNTVGPRQTGRYGMVIPRFVQQAVSGDPITVYGDGTQRRSFTWVGDVVNALIGLSEHPAAVGEVFNIGHFKDISILELAQRVKKMADSESEIVFIPHEEAYEEGFEDMQRRLPDISKIGTLLGYKPTLDLEQIIERVIAHYRMKQETGALIETRAEL
jgi:UDP-glucose 4-epimerase